MLWRVLVQFLFRLSFGLAIAMAWTSPKQVTSGFFRVHLWVLLGVNTFASAVIFLVPDEFGPAKFLGGGAAITAVLCYVGAVVWLYEKPNAGWVMLLLVTISSLYFGWQTEVNATDRLTTGTAIFFDLVTSGFVIGFTFASMLLGHWYLNTPSMQLAPLKRLILAMAVAVILRAIICGMGFAQTLSGPEPLGSFVTGALALRWLAGIVGLLVLTFMTWQTLKIPNTQSATGILYVGVIFVFIGELASRLLSAQTRFPL